MSQSGLSNIAGIPSIATTYTEDTGTATPAANNLNVLGGDGIETSGAGSTVTVTLSRRLDGTSSAVGATTTDIITLALGGSAAVYRLQFWVAGRDTATGDGVGYTVDASVRTDGAAAAVIGSEFIDADEDASLVDALIEIVASANNIILRATGVAGQTINYSAVGTYVSV